MNIVQYDSENEEYFIDYDLFETTEEVISFGIRLTCEKSYWKNWFPPQVDTPLCSAQRFDKLCQKVTGHVSKKRSSSEA